MIRGQVPRLLPAAAIASGRIAEVMGDGTRMAEALA